MILHVKKLKTKKEQKKNFSEVSQMFYYLYSPCNYRQNEQDESTHNLRC